MDASNALGAVTARGWALSQSVIQPMPIALPRALPDHCLSEAKRAIQQSWAYLTSATLVRKPAGAVDRFEGLTAFIEEGVGGGDGVRPGLDLDGSVAACDLDEFAD